LKEVHQITELRQVKALADPLRQKILGELVAEPRTTKQVADRLGLPATRLYRHVDQLHAAGLIELKETRPKRGTTEKYFQAIAERFDASDWALGGEAGSVIEQAFQDAFSAARAELRKSVQTGAVGPDGDPSSIMLAMGALRLSPEGFTKLKERLQGIAEDLGCEDEAEGASFRLLVAVYPSVE
jgi:DNA-binding transcriptional ArsR family regulator